MIRKTFKIILIVMMLIGAFIAVSNLLLHEDLYAGKWVKYLPTVPDCKGEGNTCYDMTDPN